MNRISCKKTNGGVVVSFKGTMTVDRSNQLRGALLKIFERDSKFLLDFEEIREADISFLQLLLSADRFLIKKNKELRLTGSFSDEMIRLVMLTGFFKHAQTPFTKLVRDEVWS
jgi:anti-anti-sigma regulatory factor